MKKLSRAWLFFSAVSLIVFFPATIVYAQDYEPVIGQQGKDVIWLPTTDSQVDAMLDLADVTPTDTVIDLGSGDGRIVIAAVKRGAKALGIEYNPDLVEFSRRNAEKAGVGDFVSFVQGDIFKSDFSQATVITMYLLPDLNLKLRPALLELKPGTRIVSNAFKMGEWEADRTVTTRGLNAYLWIVPAKVEGTWEWREGSVPVTLNLTRNFQKIEGSATIGKTNRPILKAQLQGDRILFTLENRLYAGRAGPDHIRGTIESKNGTMEWVATRKALSKRE
jgi:SAM-dependent methyltransferase